MKTKTLILILLASVMLAGCEVKKLQPGHDVETITNTVYKEVVRDSIVTVPADASSLEAWFECDSLNRVYLKTINQMQGQRSSMAANTKTVGKAMIITADCICDSMAIYLTLKDRYLIKEEKQSEKEIVPVKQKSKLWPGMLIGACLMLISTILFRIYVKPLMKKAWLKVKQMIFSNNIPT